MNPIIAGVAVAVTIGAIIAISAREARVALVGLAITLGAAPFLGDPMPPLSTLAARVVGAALAAYLLRAALGAASGSSVPRSEESPGGSRLGWPAEGLLAVAAWIVAVSISIRIAALQPTGRGVGGDDLLTMLAPNAMITAAGLASIVVGLVPALAGRDGVRTAIGMLVLLQGVLLFRAGIAGAPGDLEQLGGVALLIAVAIAGAILSGLDSRTTRDGVSPPGKSRRVVSPPDDEPASA